MSVRRDRLLVRAFRRGMLTTSSGLLRGLGGFAERLGEGELGVEGAGRQVGLAVQLPGVGHPFVDQDQAGSVLVEQLFRVSPGLVARLVVLA